MSDNKLMPCVCGGRGYLTDFGTTGMFRVKCSETYCECSTINYKNMIDAHEAWNTMQTALQAGWSSEVPSEAGIYLYKAQNGNIMPIEISKTGYVYYGNTEHSRNDNWTGLWYRITYPQPPQDTANGKD